MNDDIGLTAHRIFLSLYSVVCALAIFVSVSSAVVTDHWKDNIGGCILYSNVYKNVRNNSEWRMQGSDMSACNYVVFTPVFFIFICCLAIAFHLRHLFCQRCWRAEEGKSDFWATLVRILLVLCGVVTLLSLIVACMLTHGHDVTCSGLRDYVVDKGLTPWLGITKEQIHELFDRVDCGFFYSALDFGMEIGNQGNGTSVIDSHAALELAIVTSWFQFFAWLGLTAANVWLAKRMDVELDVFIPKMELFLRSIK